MARARARLLEYADWFAGERYASLQAYLFQHCVQEEEPTHRKDVAACQGCMAADAVFSTPYVRCVACMAAFLEHRVDWSQPLWSKEEADARCGFCLRAWDGMPEEDCGELETWMPRMPICNRCDRDLGWTDNWCASCNERLDPCADVQVSVRLPWIEFGVCESCAETKTAGARFLRATDRCLWCERRGEGTVREMPAHRMRPDPNSGHVCPEHAYERFFHPKKNDMLLAHAEWLNRRYPGVELKIKKARAARKGR